MRQRSDTTKTQRLLESIQEMVVGEADTTLVNGVLFRADWEEAQPNRVQMFIDDSIWQHPVYTVQFAGDAVLNKPASLKDGSEIVWVKMGWRAVVRRVSPDTDNDVIIGVTALVVIQ